MATVGVITDDPIHKDYESERRHGREFSGNYDKTASASGVTVDSSGLAARPVCIASD